MESAVKHTKKEAVFVIQQQLQTLAAANLQPPPMKMGAARLKNFTEEERKLCITERILFLCGEKEHISGKCSEKEKRSWAIPQKFSYFTQFIYLNSLVLLRND